MPVDITRRLSWMNANPDERKMLDTLQGNILKGHGRKLTLNIFFTIDAAKKAAMRGALRDIATNHMMSAFQQLDETQKFDEGGPPGGPFVATFLAHSGYQALGVPPQATPDDRGFVSGMGKAGLGDPPVDKWEAGFQHNIDGMVLIGGTANEITQKRAAIMALLQAGGAKVVKEQAGKAIANEKGDGIEHFGYVDGRSQPLPLLEDVVVEEHSGGIDKWNAGSPLDVALVPEPGSTDGVTFGSYFIFRKLDQNVRGFKTREQSLANALKLKGPDRERAGAFVVGRFEDGTPITLSANAAGNPPPNNFNYDQDKPGGKCPFHGHIRKANPRGTGGFEKPEDERKHLMIRRGIPYEDVPRQTEPKDLPDVDTQEEFDEKVAPLLPTGDVGLLFMAYNRKLADQFEFTQKNWVNNKDFPKDGKPNMLDPIIGQPDGQAAQQEWPNKWDDPASGTTPFSFADFVTMRGGEYFFAPSLTFLKAL